VKTINIPKPLAEKLNRLANDSGFDNLDKFVNFLLCEIINITYSGNDNELTMDLEGENHLLELIRDNPDVKEYYVSLYNHYLTNGDHKNAGDLKVQILNRFH